MDVEKKLQRIVERLEDKLKVLHAENEHLKETAELAELDHELAEEKVRESEAELTALKEEIHQLRSHIDSIEGTESIIERLTDENLASKTAITELQQQLADLEVLRELNEELEESHSQKHAQLQLEIEELNSHLRKTEAQLQREQVHVADLQAVAKPPGTDAPALLDLRQRVAVLGAELRAAKLDLEGYHNGILETLAKHLDLGPMTALGVQLAYNGSEEVLQDIFDCFKTYDVGTGDIRRRVLELAERQRALIDGHIDILKAVGCLAKLPDFSTLRNERLPPDLVRAALIDPSPRTAQELKDAQQQDVVAEISLTEQRCEQEPEQERELRQAEIEREKELETARLKVSLLQAKADRAKELAELVNSLDAKLTAIETQKRELQSALVESEEKLSAREAELQKTQEVPDLGVAAYRNVIKTLRTAIKRLASQGPEIEFTPLYPFGEPCMRSRVCGQPRIRRLLQAGRSFDLATESMSTKCRPKKDKAGHKAIEQLRQLSLIYSSGTFQGRVSPLELALA